MIPHLRVFVYHLQSTHARSKQFSSMIPCDDYYTLINLFYVELKQNKCKFFILLWKVQLSHSWRPSAITKALSIYNTKIRFYWISKGQNKQGKTFFGPQSSSFKSFKRLLVESLTHYKVTLRIWGLFFKSFPTPHRNYIKNFYNLAKSIIITYIGRTYWDMKYTCRFIDMRFNNIIMYMSGKNVSFIN